jgi:hypothetical protein
VNSDVDERREPLYLRVVHFNTVSVWVDEHTHLHDDDAVELDSAFTNQPLGGSPTGDPSRAKKLLQSHLKSL